MALKENPPEIPRQQGIGGAVREFLSSFRDGVTELFVQDPRIDQTLTPDFVQEFVREYNRMKHERADEAFNSEAELNLQQRIDISGRKTEDRMFEILFRRYPRIQALPENVRMKVHSRLLVECRLINGMP